KWSANCHSDDAPTKFHAIVTKLSCTLEVALERAEQGAFAEVPDTNCCRWTQRRDEGGAAVVRRRSRQVVGLRGRRTAGSCRFRSVVDVFDVGFDRRGAIG